MSRNRVKNIIAGLLDPTRASGELSIISKICLEEFFTDFGLIRCKLLDKSL